MSGLVVREGRFEFDFQGAKSVIKFDGRDHGLSRCMKAIDILVEMDDRLYVIEIKDPDHPNATDCNKDCFYQEYRGGDLLSVFVHKYRDSFIYMTATGNMPKKPVYYIVLLEFPSMLDAERLSLFKSELDRMLPVNGPPGKTWLPQYVKGCAVMDVAQWRSLFPDFIITDKTA